MTERSQPLTIVMYHYVRDVADTRFAALPVRGVAELDRQFDAIARTHTVIDLDTLQAVLRGKRTLPENAILLTFDDGYREHYETVFPRLRERGWSAVFFPVTSVLAADIVLNVNKIQFARACIAPDEIYRAVMDWLNDNRAAHDLDAPEDYVARWAVANRFDDDDAMFVKNMLQRGLPRAPRQRLIDALFSEAVAADEAAFARALYMNRDEVAAMAREGMAIGVHGHSHDWMTDLTPERLGEEIATSLDLLAGCGVPREGWCLCYPFGGVDDGVAATAASLGARVAVTTEPRVANLRRDDALRLPRLDTNDLPH